MYKRVTTDGGQPAKSEVFTQICRSVDMDQPMQLPRQEDDEAPLKIPSSSRRALEASSFLFEKEDEEEPVRKPEVTLGPMVLPEPPKLSRYS